MNRTIIRLWANHELLLTHQSPVVPNVGEAVLIGHDCYKVKERTFAYIKDSITEEAERYLSVDVILEKETY